MAVPKSSESAAMRWSGVKETLDSLEPVISCRFIVTFSNKFSGNAEYTFAFSKISGIGYKSNVRYINEGGRNNSPIMLRCPVTEGHHLTFERGLQIYTSNTGKSLIGANSRQVLFARHSQGEIKVIDVKKELKAVYRFTSQGIINWEVSTLDAMSNQPIIETFTISHTGLQNVALKI